ncbi:MAG: acyltransferase [Bacteroidetes bacterium]|nr:acyltransferase [Bacteroidota bacterium]
MLQIINILKYPRLNGIFIPFKTYIKSFIFIRNSAKVYLSGRLTIGNPDSKAARISVAPVNIYFGFKTEVKLGESISIGPGVNIIAKDGAKLTIGSGTYFTSDMHLEAAKSINIGSDCAISWGVTIIDTNHHKILSEESNTNYGEGVTIGNHVWVGCNVTILKGTEIGDNSIIAAGSLVKGKYPKNTMIAGNPAKVIKQNINWE